MRRTPLLILQFLLILLIFALSSCAGGAPREDALRIGVFRVDVTPPLGSPLCDGLVLPARRIADPLSAKGVVLLGAGAPIVLCAVDWVGIGNGGYDAWRSALAAAAGTTPDRVAVHCLHPHDTPGCDFEADDVLTGRGLGGAMFPVEFAHEAIARVAGGVRGAVAQPRAVTHVGHGAARVAKVASNRRVLGPDGKVRHVRYSSCRDPIVRAAPEGVIDPWMRMVSFWDADTPLVTLTYYATHPQSHYGDGGVSPDFVGLARDRYEAAVGVSVVHFNGAGGNVAAGKYNDGSPKNRPILRDRLVDAMGRAWAATEREPITAAEVGWRVVAVPLPPAQGLDAAALSAELGDESLSARDRIRAARDLVWLRRASAARGIELSCLTVAGIRLLHLPGELFVEYQLAASAMVPDGVVCTAAYGDYGPGYIGTAIAYGQGGYETGRVSRVAPSVEGVLLAAIQALLRESN